MEIHLGGVFLLITEEDRDPTGDSKINLVNQIYEGGLRKHRDCTRWNVIWHDLS